MVNLQKGMVFGVILLAVVAFTGIGLGCENLSTWRFSNSASVPVMVYKGAAEMGMLRPGESRDLQLGFPSSATAAPSVYVVKGYEFKIGEGNVIGWRENQKDILGSVGDLIFCRVYTWEDLKKNRLHIEVTRNVEQTGLRPDPTNPSCP